MLPDSFWLKVKITEAEGCWDWTAATSNGYGCFGLNRRTRAAHRIAYESIFGDVPNGLELDHLCRNKLCVNPWHLDAVTHSENVRRGDAGKASGAKNAAKTHCIHGHEYSGINLYINPSGSRARRACVRFYAREYRKRKAHHE